MTEVRLISNDGYEFKVPLEAINMSTTIKNLFEDIDVPDEATPMSEIDGSTLKRMVDYCMFHHVNKSEKPEDIAIPWNSTFCDVTLEVLVDMILAANHMDIKPCMTLLCKNLASMMRGKTPDEIRIFFNIPNDFTPEEEQKVLAENEWGDP